MARVEYYHDVHAPQPTGLLPAAYAVTRNDAGDILLVRRVDDGYWELPGGRVEIGESAAVTAVREVNEETGVHIEVTALAGVYSDPAHVLAYPREERVYQQFAVCFHAVSRAHEAWADRVEASTAAWFAPDATMRLPMHPAVRRRLTDALLEPGRAHFD